MGMARCPTGFFFFFFFLGSYIHELAFETRGFGANREFWSGAGPVDRGQLQCAPEPTGSSTCRYPTYRKIFKVRWDATESDGGAKYQGCCSGDKIAIQTHALDVVGAVRSKIIRKC
jgi:hypothetical protein